MIKNGEQTVVHTSSKERLDNLEKQVQTMTDSINALIDANRTLTLQLASVSMNLNGQITQNNTLRSELKALVEIVANKEELSLEAIKAKVIAASVAQLENNVKILKDKNLLVDTEEVAADSFIVAQQQDEKGNIVNTRIQFLLSELDTESQLKILSKKAGETANMGEGQPTLYILEVYKATAFSNEENAKQQA